MSVIKRGAVVPYIGTWIETFNPEFDHIGYQRRTLYRYVD